MPPKKKKILTSQKTKNKRSNEENEFVDNNQVKKSKREQQMLKNFLVTNNETPSTSQKSNEQASTNESISQSTKSNLSKKRNRQEINRLVLNNLSETNNQLDNESNLDQNAKDNEIIELKMKIDELENKLSANHQNLELIEKINELERKFSKENNSEDRDNKLNQLTNLYKGGPFCNSDRLRNALQGKSLSVFVSRLLTAIVPFKEVYRRNATGTAAKHPDRDTGLESIAFNKKYTLILVKSAKYNLPTNNKIFKWLDDGKKVPEDSEDDWSDPKKLFNYYDSDLVKVVKAEVARKIGKLNSLFRWMKTTNKKIDKDILKKYGLLSTDILSFSGFDEYEKDRENFFALDENIDEELFFLKDDKKKDDNKSNRSDLANEEDEETSDNLEDSNSDSDVVRSKGTSKQSESESDEDDEPSMTQEELLEYIEKAKSMLKRFKNKK